MSRWFLTYGFAEIDDDLVLGAYPLDESDVTMLQRLGVKRVLNLVEDGEYQPGQREAVEAALRAADIQETRLRLTDFGNLPQEELDSAIRQLVVWRQEGQRVYVHCRAGWQRSAAVVAGALAEQHELGIEDALDLVRQRKPSADPLPHQREDLRRWWEARHPRMSREQT